MQAEGTSAMTVLWIERLDVVMWCRKDEDCERNRGTEAVGRYEVVEYLHNAMSNCH